MARHFGGCGPETEASDVRLVTFTVDPENDTPEQLVKYADAFGADKDGWLFLNPLATRLDFHGSLQFAESNPGADQQYRDIQR